MKNRILLFLLLTLEGILLSQAKISLPTIFSDNMMFQRDVPVKIWGTGTPDSNIEIKFLNQSVNTKVNNKGSWQLKLKPLSANKTPSELIIFENGNKSAVIKNILVGEVWLAAGQSNMELKMSQCDSFKAAKNRANYPIIRYFDQPNVAARTPQKNSPEGSKWLICSPETIEDFSGVAFHFAELLSKDLDVPVGIIYSASGGTEIAAWLPREASESSEYLKKYIGNFLKEAQAYDEAAYKKALEAYNKRTDTFNKKREAARKSASREPTRPWDDLPPNPVSPRLHFRSPTFHFNSTVAPITNFSLRGVIWYQGESDARVDKRDYFEENFKILINSWRTVFGNPDMPFLYVQLSSFAHDNQPDETVWANMRWIQTKTLKIPHTAMANIIDTGLKTNIHPRDKETVGVRLEKLALATVYGKSDVKAFCPMFTSAKYSESRVEINYETYGRKLVSIGKPKGFELKINGNWVEGNPILENQKVIVRAKTKGKKIEGVRYLWKNWALPDVWLYNEDKLPAISFLDER